MKKILATLLAVLMLATVMFAVPVTTSAATIIDNVKVTDIDEPFAGDTPDFTGSVVGEGYIIYYISYYDITEGSFLEEDGSEPFIHNHEYRVDVVLQYESGYEFKTEGNLPAVTGKLMGWTVKASKVEGTVAWAEIRLSHEFTAYKEIKEVKVTDIDEPYAGMSPDYTGSVAGEGYKILYIDYYDKTDGRFLKEENNEHFVHGHTYEMQVVLQYENGYEFATNEDGSSALTGVLIGYGCKPSKMDGTVAWAEVIMRKSFNASKIIRDVSASGVDEAVAGKTPDFEVVAGSDEYEVIDVSYYDITSSKSLEKGDGKVFECGHEYRLDITLSANSSYEFAVDGQLPAVTGTINGNTADVEKVYNTTAFAEVILRRTFIAPHDYHTFYVSATPKAEGRIDVICGACEKT